MEEFSVSNSLSDQNEPVLDKILLISTNSWLFFLENCFKQEIDKKKLSKLWLTSKFHSFRWLLECFPLRCLCSPQVPWLLLEVEHPLHHNYSLPQGYHPIKILSIQAVVLGWKKKSLTLITLVISHSMNLSFLSNSSHLKYIRMITWSQSQWLLFALGQKMGSKVAVLPVS